MSLTARSNVKQQYSPEPRMNQEHYSLNQEKNKNYKNNVLINVEYQRLQKFKFFSNN